MTDNLPTYLLTCLLTYLLNDVICHQPQYFTSFIRVIRTGPSYLRPQDLGKTLKMEEDLERKMKRSEEGENEGKG